MTAVSDSFAGRLFIESIRFTGTGLTAAQNIVITDINGGLICTHTVLAANEDEFIAGPFSPQHKANGIKINSGTATGSWQVEVLLR